MTLDDLRNEVEIDLNAIDQTLAELIALQIDLGGRNPTVREKAAAATFLAQLYSGAENILKRINRFYDLPLPSSENWHLELFLRFCEPGYPPLPILIDKALATSLTPYRKFRHVFHHGYSFQLDWERMREGAENAGDVIQRFKTRVIAFVG